MQTIFAMYLIIGALMALISIPLIARRIKPNYLYGFRLRATLTDEDTWYAVNQYCGRLLFGLGIATALATIIFYPLGLSVDVYSSILALVMIIGLTVVMFMCLRYLSRYLQTKKSQK